MLEPPPIPNTNQPERRPKRGRMILIAVVVLLAAFPVWKVIDYSIEPSLPVFAPTPERVDALRYLAAAKNNANAAGDEFNIWGEIARTEAGAGDIAGARTTAKAIKEEGARFFALIAVAAEQGKMGDPAGAKVTVKSLPRNAAEFIGEAFAFAATAQARRGDVAGAKAIANIITDRSFRAEAVSGIAMAQAKAGDVTGAKATVGAITEDSHKASALAEIGAAQAKAGDKAGATQSLAQAEALANASKDPWGKNVALRDLAVAQAKAGDVINARITAGVVGTLPLDSPSAWRGIAKVQARAGDIAGAKATANASAEKEDKALALSDVALAQARSGDRAGASETFAEAKAAAGPPTESYKGMTWCEIAAAQAKAADITAAQATINSVTEEGFKSIALAAIAAAQVEAGDLAGAKVTVNAGMGDHFDDQRRLFPGLVAIVAAQAVTEGFPATERWVQNLSEPKARTLYSIALAKVRLDPQGTKKAGGDDEE